MQIALVLECGEGRIDVGQRTGEHERGVGRAVAGAERQTGGVAQSELTVTDRQRDLQIGSTAVHIGHANAAHGQFGVFIYTQVCGHGELRRVVDRLDREANTVAGRERSTAAGVAQVAHRHVHRSRRRCSADRLGT